MGYAVARAGIYTFRNLPHPSPQELERAIRREQRKPASNQGPRTFARDLRRTLALLGFLKQRADSSWQVSDLGKRVLAFPDLPDKEATALWISALVELSLFDSPTEGATHPALNMLKMVARNPGIEKRWLAFALDMRDDSDAELERVIALKRLSFEAALKSVGASKYMAANAVKILPSLLEQIGLMTISRGTCALTASGTGLVSAANGSRTRAGLHCPPGTSRTGG